MNRFGVILIILGFTGCQSAPNFVRHGATLNVVQNGTENAIGFHSYRQLSNGRWVGKLGADEYLLDGNFNPVGGARGFHQIIPQTDGSYVGKIANQSFALTSSGRMLDENKHPYKIRVRRALTERDPNI
jgi:hypothetical protein